MILGQTKRDYDSIVEAYWDNIIYQREKEEEEYENECLLNLKTLFKEFEDLRKEYDHLFSKAMWELIESEIENVTPYTTLSQIMISYIEDGRMWSNWEKLNPNYTKEMEAEFDKASEVFYDLF